MRLLLPLLLCLSALASSAQQPAGFYVWTGTAHGFWTNRTATTNLNVRVPVAKGVTNFAAVTEYDTNGNQLGFSDELAFLPATNTATLAWVLARANYWKLFVLSAASPAGPFTNVSAAPVLSLTNPTSVQQYFKLLAMVTNSP